MIPSILTQQLRQGIDDFLRTAFPVSTPHFHHIMDDFIAGNGNLFRGPYLSVQLPFRTGSGKRDFFAEIPLKFPPYLHQEQAFKRLSGNALRSTIVATGTGSGKTESFLVPILNYCFQHRGERGIKAILIYPMNALATDQAGRIARMIYGNADLKGMVTAGLYVGQSEREPYLMMSEGAVITHKDTLRHSPPDILITNYKMLDYLLIRAKDRALWQFNEAETLRFLVVDELHTFDGAQGSDLACLIRRLKSRLKTPPGYLCAIGTSATLGSESEKGKLSRYAREVFGEVFDDDAIITESRLSAGEFLEQSMITRTQTPPRQAAEKLKAGYYADYRQFVMAQHELWFNEVLPEKEFDNAGWKIALGEKLLGHSFFQNLIKVLRGEARNYNEILFDLDKCTPEFKEADPSYGVDVINSLLALVSTARSGRAESLRPFLTVRYQLWLREMGRMVGSVSQRPALAFADDLTAEQMKTYLPVIHCRECNSMGWAGLKRKGDSAITFDLKTFYAAFFKFDLKVTFLFPEAAVQGVNGGGQLAGLCAGCLRLTDRIKSDTCPNCGHAELIRVFMPDLLEKRTEKLVVSHNCPYCGGHNSLTILGSRAASLTSVLIAQLFASTFNDDKKLLTFSDSVQDAAHRAGFFAGRTFRFNFRGAIQQSVQHVLAGKARLTLAEAPEAFIKYWNQRMDRNTFISTFLAPNLEWLPDFEGLKHSGSLPKDSNLLQLIEKRIEWEIFSEYGFRTRIGRTLEKTGSSTAHIDAELLGRVIFTLLPILQNEIGGLQELTAAALRVFIIGFLTRLKNQGGIYHHELESYVESWGQSFIINRIPWMPNFSPMARTPAFLTTKRTYRFDHLLSGRGGRKSWYELWADKCFSPYFPLISELAGDIYDIVLKILVKESVLFEKINKHDKVWGMLPNALQITDQVVQFRCGACHHNVSAPVCEAKDWQGAICLRFNCGGQYQQESVKTDYYGNLYRSGNIQRIFAAEHTGLLDRDARQNLEARFKSKERYPWDPNLLSCTPTLELGIDIGELSSVILCSTPPAQANYLQRIGRAGRHDGNALNITLANAAPHDLYFFSEPESMISGKVEPPGVFLNASAVLERQFTAFGFDRWVETGISVNAVPGQLRQVLANLEPVNIKKFPHNFINFIELRQTELFDAFIQLFSDTITAESINYLKIFIEGDRDKQGSLAFRIMDKLHYYFKERESLKKKINMLSGKIQKKKEEPVKDKNYQVALDELIREKEGLGSLVSRINDRHTLNFFTDEGLIPNYAFPEAGVILHSIIYRRKHKPGGDGRNYDVFSYHYERSAASAISELAPSGSFYAGGRKVNIDQIDLSVAEIEIWRMCNNCSYMAVEGSTAAYQTCPQCGSTLWSDSGQKRQMLKMRQMFANTSDPKSRISDDSDNREITYYNKHIVVGYQESAVTDAYRIESEDFPFGFQFLSGAEFREMNFGEKEDTGGKLTVAGIEISTNGFIICKYCGKVQNRKGEIKHALSCPSRNKDSEKNLTECVYLYRNFTSEAILLLLPVTTFEGSDRKLHSFIAALHLGLKQVFGGNIDHLQTTVHEEPIPESNQRKKYLVLYDTVPGGTGYLKQLMRSDKPMMLVFEKALEAMQNCACNRNPAKDGCYLCLFAYRASYNMAATSRNTAIEMFSRILSYKDQMTQTKTIKDIKMNSLLESELEARFIEALRRIRSDDLPVMLKKELVNGKPGYFYKIGDRAWYIEPQVNMNPADGVSVPSKADFVFRPARVQPGEKSVVVFTDGFSYHKHRIGKDLSQRRAILRSGKYHVWSLSWKDIMNAFHPQGAYFDNYMEVSNGSIKGKYQQLISGYRIEKLSKMHKTDSFQALIHFLQAPESRQWAYHSFVHGMIRLDDTLRAQPEKIEAWFKTLANHQPEEVVELFSGLVRQSGEGYWLGLFEPESENNLAKLFVVGDQKAIRAGDISGLYAAGYLDDDPSQMAASSFESAWNGYLRLFNMMQFLPNNFFTSRQGLSEGYGYEGIQVKSAETINEEKWHEIKELTEAGLQGVIDRLAERKSALPEVGFELSAESGEIVAEAEIAWPEEKIAVLRPEQWQFSEMFEKSGWRVFSIAAVTANPEIIEAVLTE